MSVKKTNKEKRMESDTRIINAAIRYFGQYGYTNSTVAQIAKSAGVSAGLITQRYVTKENLFSAAFRQVMEHNFSEIHEDTTPREYLAKVLHDIKNMSEENPDAFMFCCMLHGSTDIPKEVTKGEIENHRQSRNFRILQEAQKKGMFPQGKLDSLIASFCANVFFNIMLCRKYNLPIPEDKAYLDAVGFQDDKTADERIWTNGIITALVNQIETMVYMNITENTGKLLKVRGEIMDSDYITDIREELKRTVERYVCKGDRQRICDYLNPDVLKMLPENENMIVSDCRTIEGENKHLMLIPIARNSENHVTEAVCCSLKRVKRYEG